MIALEKKWTDAYKLRNITLMTSMLADDFVMTVEDGNIYVWVKSDGQASDRRTVQRAAGSVSAARRPWLGT